MGDRSQNNQERERTALPGPKKHSTGRRTPHHSESSPPSSSLQAVDELLAPNPSGPRSSYYTATFDSKTMTQVQEKPPKKLEKSESKAIWNNRNMVCPNHKRSNKKCDPATCPGNGQYKQRHSQPHQIRADESPRFPSHHAAEMPPSQITSLPVNTPCPLTVEPVVDIHEPGNLGNGTPLHIESAIKDRPWITNGNIYSRTIPRAYPAVGLSDLDSQPEKYYTIESYSASSTPFGDSDAFGVNGEAPAGARQEDNDGNGDGNGGQSDEREDRFDNGDWWDGYDKDWADGKGPSENCNYGSGGGYSKPGGGYYALSSNFGAKVKTSNLEEGLSNLKL